MWDAEKVANWFLVRHSSKMQTDGAEDEYITQMKLHKLLYYAQGVFLAMFNKRLFDEEMLAWTHGPVVRSIYDKYQGIRELGTENLDEEQLSDYQTLAGNDNTRVILEVVYETYGKYSAGQLRNMTHEETPWKEAWKSGNGSEPLKDETVTKYFKENIVEVD